MYDVNEVIMQTQIFTWINKLFFKLCLFIQPWKQRRCVYLVCSGRKNQPMKIIVFWLIYSISPKITKSNFNDSMQLAWTVCLKPDMPIFSEPLADVIFFLTLFWQHMQDTCKYLLAECWIFSASVVMATAPWYYASCQPCWKEDLLNIWISYTAFRV